LRGDVLGLLDVLKIDKVTLVGHDWGGLIGWQLAALAKGYPKVRVPVMGIWSDGDPALGEKQMRDSARYVDAEFRFERIHDADHWLQLTAHEQVNRLLLDFIGGDSHSAAAA
ncbi:MAG: alpha/beta hydrolase, partial [Oxalobacteraceae bacterium]